MREVLAFEIVAVGEIEFFKFNHVPEVLEPRTHDAFEMPDADANRLWRESEFSKTIWLRLILRLSANYGRAWKSLMQKSRRMLALPGQKIRRTERMRMAG